MKKILIFCIFILCASPTFSKYVNYPKIDRHAKNAPILKNNKNLDKLVSYLIQPFSSDTEKARVIFSWIIYHIDYDAYVFKKMTEYKVQREKHFGIKKPVEIPQNDILEIRAGVCQDIAALYTKMGRMAGLDVNFVSGNVAPCTFDDLVTGLCRHAWNVVKIDGQWEYVDPTWAMDAPLVFTDVNSLRAYVRALEKRTKRDQNLKARKDRRINEKWWLTDKEEMIKTHLSDDEKWQLQKKKITLPEFIGIDKTAYKTRMRSRKRRETIKREVEQIRQTGSVSTGSF